MSRRLARLFGVLLAACSGAPPQLLPFPWDELDADGREAMVVYRTRTSTNGYPMLASVTGRLIAAEDAGLYVLAGEQRGFLPWAAVRALYVPDPGRPHLRPEVTLRREGGDLPAPLDVARETQVTDQTTPNDRIRLARLSRFPAGRPPSWRALSWPIPADSLALESPHVVPAPRTVEPGPRPGD